MQRRRLRRNLSSRQRHHHRLRLRHLLLCEQQQHCKLNTACVGSHQCSATRNTAPASTQHSSQSHPEARGRCCCSLQAWGSQTSCNRAAPPGARVGLAAATKAYAGESAAVMAASVPAVPGGAPNAPLIEMDRSEWRCGVAPAGSRGSSWESWRRQQRHQQQHMRQQRASHAQLLLPALHRNTACLRCNMLQASSHTWHTRLGATQLAVDSNLPHALLASSAACSCVCAPQCCAHADAARCRARACVPAAAAAAAGTTLDLHTPAASSAPSTVTQLTARRARASPTGEAIKSTALAPQAAAGCFAALQSACLGVRMRACVAAPTSRRCLAAGMAT